MAASTQPSLSTDQVAAFVELARHGSLRAAAENLFITEQGLRSRLLALEQRLGVELYRKSRGLRRRTPLTTYGQQFLPHARAFLQHAGHLFGLFSEPVSAREIHVIASQYLIAYVLIDVVRRFHRAYPELRVRLSARTERDIEEALLQDPEISFGLAAPYEQSSELAYRHLFSMPWSLITPPHHPLAMQKRVRLADVVNHPLIMYERGSTGRQHVVDAFQHLGLSPTIEMEATNTDLVVRMVEAGLGVSIVPLHPSGAVTRGRRVRIGTLRDSVRPIDSGILMRRNETPTGPAQKLLEFLQT